MSWRARVVTANARAGMILLYVLLGTLPVEKGGLGLSPFGTGAFYGLFGLFGIVYQVRACAEQCVCLPRVR